MLGEWIKIEHELPHKPEVQRMAAILGIPQMAVVGHLVCFWSWVDKHLSQNCPRIIGTKVGIDTASMRDGFTDAMLAVGWLAQDADGSFTIPGYDEHLSKTAKTRAIERKKKKQQRENGTNVPARSGQMKGHTQGQEEGHERDTIEEEEELEKEEERECGPAAAGRRSPARFVKPSVDEVAAYCDERANGIVAAKFVDYYEANGWRVGKSPMKDWKATVRNWERNGSVSTVNSTIETPEQKKQRHEQERALLNDPEWLLTGIPSTTAGGAN